MGPKSNKTSSPKKDAPVSASVGSPSRAGKNAGGNSMNPGGGSPPGRKSGKDCKKSSRLPPGWYIRCRKVAGGIRLVYVTLSNFVDDAYIHTAVQKLGEAAVDGGEDHPLLNCSLWGPADLRTSLVNPAPLKNARNDYTRKVFVQLMDAEDEPPEKGLELCHVFKDFFEERENNRYGTQVFIQQPGWNMDNPDASVPLPKLDNFLVYADIVSIIKDSFDGVDASWAASNMEAAMCYFTEGHIPHEAHADLGFPMESVMAGNGGGAFAPGFNPGSNQR